MNSAFIFLTINIVCAASAQSTVSPYEQGKVDFDARHYRLAEQEFGKAETEAPRQTDALFLRAKALIHLKEFGSADHWLREYLEDHEHSAGAKYLLAYTLFRENKPSDSLAMYTEAATLQRPMADDFKAIGLDYVLLNDQENAIKWLGRSVSENPKDAEANYYLGRSYYVQNEFPRAVAAFQKALELDPSFAKAENNLGLSFAAQNKPELAEAAYRKAIAMNIRTGTQSPEPYVNLADLLSRGGHNEEVMRLLGAAERMGGASDRREEIRGRVLLAEGKLGEAEAALRTALAAKPNEGALHFLLGRILKREGKLDEAEKEFRETKILLASKAALKSE